MNIFTAHSPYIIAGPCGIESENQLDSIAKSIQTMPVQMLRGGVWKPRSKPGYFEGLGEPALALLQKMKTKYGIKVCTEVANKEQVARALHYQLDAVWIGARTTVNPFLVQEIADALQGEYIAVLIKNPINPDVELWSGAIERILKAGIQSVAAIHRGFSSYDTHSKYRNKPNWAIPIEIKRRYKDIPMLCDISHICGNRTLLAEVAQKALDLDFDGLMIETHPSPDDALSDAKQQITPDALHTLLQNLHIRQSSCHNAQNEIEEIRQIIDTMDAEIVDLLGKRMERVKDLGEIKKENNMAIFQQERWREIVESRTKWGKNNELNQQFILKLFELIHDQSIHTQLDWINYKK